MKKRLLVFVVLLLISVLAIGCGGTDAEEPGKEPSDNGQVDKQLKVAMITEGSVNDGGWNASALSGLEQIEEIYGAEISYSEQVAPASMAQVIRTYAREGYDIIYGHGFQFDEPMKEVSPEFPDTTFITVNGTSAGGNLYSTGFLFGELGYFTGMVAGLMTETNKVGVVAAMEAPTVVADVDTFKEGVEKVNPGTNVAVSYIGSWNDIPKAKEAALAQLADGADVLLVMGNSFSVGVFQAAEEADALAMGWVSDQNFMAPDTIITSGLQSVEALYLEMTDVVLGNGEAKRYVYGMAEDAQSIAPFIDKVPQEVVDEVEQAVQSYLDGDLILNIPNL